jgi:hypothetical protein
MDVTCDVLDPFEFHAGTDSSDGIVSHWESATLSLQLLGERWNPFSGPYAGLLGPQTPIRVRWRPAGDAEWRGVFLGFVDDDGFKWSRRGEWSGVAEVAATDGTRLLNAADLIGGPLVGASETAGSRISRLADLSFWEYGRAIDVGGVPMNPTDTKGNAWTQMLAVADADLGALWIDGDGTIRYVSQARVEIDAEPDWRITCEPPNGDGVPRIPAIMLEGQQPGVRRNIVSIARAKPEDAPDPVVSVRRDERSRERFGPHAYSRTDLPHAEDSWSAQLSAAVLQTGAWPSSAPLAVEVNSRFGEDAAFMLLAMEPDAIMEVTDMSGRVWTMAPTGWDVTVSRKSIGGTVRLSDVTRFIAGRWDSDGWDKTKWSY